MSPADREPQQQAIPKYGLIGFFDVLGYGQLHENNKIPEVVTLLERTMLRMPGKVPERLLEVYKTSEARAAVKELLGDYEWLLFSDTILCCAELTKDLSPPERMIRWMLYLLAVAELAMVSFDEGLPLRGAIAVGHYFVGPVAGHRIFAGPSIIEAHLLEKDCDVAAIALTPTALEEFNRVMWAGRNYVVNRHRSDKEEADRYFRLLQFLNALATPYSVPLKRERSIPTRVVQWTYLKPVSAPLDGDFYEVVTKSFTAYGKRMDDATVKVKAEHTSKMLRHFANETERTRHYGNELGLEIGRRVSKSRR